MMGAHAASHRIAVSIEKTRPFLKWAGGKARYLEPILKHLPQGTTLVEPFVGAGAVFLNSNFENYLLNDINGDLIQVYRFLQKKPDLFIQDCKKWFKERYNTPEQYQKLRARFNSTSDLWLKSQLFLYLNRHSYNGLCRYNQQGNFNAPYGRYIKPYFPEHELGLFAQKLKGAQLSQQCFSKLFTNLPSNAVLYCDPPYYPLNKTAYFAQYTQNPFPQEKHIELANYALQAVKQGHAVLISNNDTPEIRKWYKGARFYTLESARLINCRPERRGAKVTELLALFI